MQDDEGDSEDDEEEEAYEMTEEERLEAAFDAKHMRIGEGSVVFMNEELKVLI